MQLFNIPQDEPGKAWPAIVMGFFVSLGGLLFGYDTGSISGILAMPYWQQTFSTGTMNAAGDFDISTREESLIVSILSAGTFVGALMCPFFADRIGRKATLIGSCWAFKFGVILQVASAGIPLFVAGRFFAGLGVGFISVVVPLYQSETAPKWIRGAIIGAFQLAITVGILFAAVMNNVTRNVEGPACYRVPVGLQIIWGFGLFLGMCFMPESPRYLIRRGRDQKAAAALSRLRRLDSGHNAIAAEVREIKANFDFEAKKEKISYLRCFVPPILKRQFTGMALQALQQLTGINFIFYYGTKYFENSGISSGFTITMITSTINVASTIPGIWAIEKWGRRPLLLWGAIGMAVSQLVVAVSGYLSSGQTDAGEMFVTNAHGQRVAVSFVCIFIFFFASTWGPLPWVVTGEIFPLQTRAKSLSITTATNWLVNWAVAYSTPYLVNFGKGHANLQSKIFFVWFAACFLCIAFVYFFIYETKGLSLEQVDSLYHEVKAARDSRTWVPSSNWDQQNAKNNGPIATTTTPPPQPEESKSATATANEENNENSQREASEVA